MASETDQPVIDDQTELFSDLSKQWGGVRDLFESFANTYYLKQPVKTGNAYELMQAGFDFSTHLALLWLDGVSVVAKAGGRLADEALRAAREQRGPAADQHNET